MVRSRFRSVRYDLAAAVEVARMVDSAGGAVAADILAPALGYSGTNNGAYLTRVANARLFGVVTGRGRHFETTERGRKILVGAEPDASDARREAFLAVPLFRAVADAAAPKGGLLPEDLASWLETDFGEVASKSQSAADRLIASAGQAGLLSGMGDGKYQLTALLTKFTPVDKHPLPERLRQLGLRKDTRLPSREDVAVAENGLWLEEDHGGTSKRIPIWRRVGVVAAAAVVLIVVAVPVALVAAGSPSQPAAGRKPAQHPHLGKGPAEHQVLSALSATTDSGNFDFSYTISSTPPSGSAPTTTVCHEVQVPAPTGSSNSNGSSPATPLVAGGGSAEGPMTPANGTLPPGFQWRTQKICNGPTVASNPPVQGGGVINTNPLAMVASANIGDGLDVSVRVDGTDVYEGSSGDTGLAPQASDATASGTSLPGFASLTEGTLGDREGAVAMMGMASPTGYLDLIQPAVDAAAKTGTGTVDGTPVTVYQVSNNLDALATAAGTTGGESQTITTALALLKAQGYTSNTAMVSIDGGGFIRQVKSTDAFSDGGSVSLEAAFSNFGCAGTVLMPGQTGADAPPAGCTSPDGSSASPAATTPSTSASTTPTTLTPGSHISSTPSTIEPPSSTPTTVGTAPPESTPPSTGVTTTTTASPTTSTLSVP